VYVALVNVGITYRKRALRKRIENLVSQ